MYSTAGCRQKANSPRIVFPVRGRGCGFRSRWCHAVGRLIIAAACSAPPRTGLIDRPAPATGNTACGRPCPARRRTRGPPPPPRFLVRGPQRAPGSRPWSLERQRGARRMSDPRCADPRSSPEGTMVEWAGSWWRRGESRRSQQFPGGADRAWFCESVGHVPHEPVLQDSKRIRMKPITSLHHVREIVAD